MTRHFKIFWSDNSGATAIEYALVATIVSLSIVVGAKAIGLNLQSKFSMVSGNLS